MEKSNLLSSFESSSKTKSDNMNITIPPAIINDSELLKQAQVAVLAYTSASEKVTALRAELATADQLLKESSDALATLGVTVPTVRTTRASNGEPYTGKKRGRKPKNAQPEAAASEGQTAEGEGQLQPQPEAVAA